MAAAIAFQRLWKAFCCALLFVVVQSTAQATDRVITNPQKSSLDKRFEYPIHVLRLALKKTENEYGPFDVQPYPAPLSRKRALNELKIGRLSVFSAPTRPSWEESAIPIRIPLRKGLMSYRLFLIRADRQNDFSEISSLEEIQKLTVGQGTQWSTTAAMKKLGFTIEGSTEYEALFGMLDKQRFDYFPRTMIEIFTEFDLRKEKFPDMRIEKKLAFFMPLPYYFFVTPKRPDLAKRIEKGLLKMVYDGTLDALFTQYHQDNIKRANLKDRRIFKLDNPNLPEETPLEREEFWYQPLQ